MILKMNLSQASWPIVEALMLEMLNSVNSRKFMRCRRGTVRMMNCNANMRDGCVQLEITFARTTAYRTYSNMPWSTSYPHQKTIRFLAYSFMDYGKAIKRLKQFEVEKLSP